MKKTIIFGLLTLTCASSAFAMDCKKDAIDAALQKAQNDQHYSLNLDSAKKIGYDTYEIVLESTEDGVFTYKVVVDTSDDQCSVNAQDVTEEK
jgi:hypothetical protein